MCGQRKGSHSSFPAAGPAARAAIHQRHRKEVSHVQMHPYAASRVVRERQRDMQAQAQRQRQARQVMAQARESRRARAAPAPRRQSMATGRFAVREPFRWPPRLSARDRSRRSSPTAAPPTAWVSSPGRDARRTCGAGREPFGIEEVDEMPTARPLLDLDHPAGGRAARVDHGDPLGLNGICHAVREGMCLGNVRCSAWLGGWAARRESGLGWRGLARIRLPGRDGGG